MEAGFFLILILAIAAGFLLLIAPLIALVRAGKDFVGFLVAVAMLRTHQYSSLARTDPVTNAPTTVSMAASSLDGGRRLLANEALGQGQKRGRQTSVINGHYDMDVLGCIFQNLNFNLVLL